MMGDLQQTRGTKLDTLLRTLIAARKHMKSQEARACSQVFLNHGPAALQWVSDR